MTTSLLGKSDVTQRLGISERTLENLVNEHKFPPGLRLGKHVVWAESVVEQWLLLALAPQMTWAAPQPTRKARRPA